MRFPLECFTLQSLMRLSIIIVSYNVKYFLEQCLHSVLAAVKEMEAEVLVVDNRSNDGSLEYLQPLFKTVHFVDAGGNLGFAKANNLALQQARGEYILFLNPDTLVPENCFSACIGFMAAHPKAGALGVRMLDGSGRFLPESKRSFPTITSAFYKLTGAAALFRNSGRFNRYALGHLDQRQDHPVDVLAGAYLLARKAILEKTGGFDESYFMYGEDIDLSYRIRQLGLENWYFSGSSIIHFKGESSRKGSIRHSRMFYNAMIVFVDKHYGQKRSALLKLLLNAGIRLRGAWTIATAPFLRIKEAEKIPAVVLMAGSEEYLPSCRILLQKTKMAGASVAELPVDFGSNVFDQLATIIKMLNETKADSIIFCHGDCGIKNIISLIEKLGPVHRYFFYAAGSNCIVGSPSGSSQGMVFAPGNFEGVR